MQTIEKGLKFGRQSVQDAYENKVIKVSEEQYRLEQNVEKKEQRSKEIKLELSMKTDKLAKKHYSILKKVTAKKFGNEHPEY